MRVLLCCIAFVAVTTQTHAGDYEKAWEALHKNDKVHAYELFRKVLKSDPAHKQNAYAALVLLESYDGRGDAFLSRYPSPFSVITDLNPYTYALWFSDGMLGPYGIKEGKELENLNTVLTDPRFNGSLHAAAKYYKGLHYMHAGQITAAAGLYSQIGALNNWQFVGSFDNISGSGFNKDYGPLKEPNKGKGFTSYNNTSIDWFTPSITDNAGWMFVGTLFPAASSVGYAQTFVYSPAEQDAILCLGGNGSLKAWVNDKLLIAQEDELATELDKFNVRVHLKKGYNRVLVQIGFTNPGSNFIVRLTDDKYETLKGISTSGKVETYVVDNSTDTPELLPHFAESYFKKQAEKYPNDPIYAILLAKVYNRNQQFDKSKDALFRFFEKNPGDPLLAYQYLECLSSRYDRTDISAVVEMLKQMDPDNTLVMQGHESELEDEKKWADALELVNRLEAREGQSVWTISKRMFLHANLQHVDSMVSLLKKAYEVYPDELDVVMGMYAYNQKMVRNPAEAIRILEKYAAGHNSTKILEQLAEDYFQQNEPEKGLAALRNIIQTAPYELYVYSPIITHFFAAQQYDSAIHYLEIEHSISPYNSSPLGTIATCYLQKGDKAKALDYYKQALALFAGGTTYREKIRELENKPDVFSYFPKMDYYAAINKDLKAPQDTAKSYYYIFDDENVVLHAEGASEQVTNTAIYINKKDAIEQWKEISIPYNSTYSDLTIIKAEVVKANGTKISAETYDNDIVFTRLEPGDVIYYNYKVSNYGIGRLGREYWDKFYFQASVPSKLARYSLMVAAPLSINYVMKNADEVKPVESDHEDFHMYTWEMKNVPAFKDEPYSPSLGDIGKVLHVSTVKSWDVIAEWYSDVTRQQSKENFDVLKTLQQIFPKGEASKLSNDEKAKKIYNFIEQNISYSSVAFRQGAYIPQRASKTLNTRLGDCKDVSTLFVSLARKVGLDANLVLVSTRRNGQQSMVLPSMEFNHCIARFKDGDNYRYLELTDNQLPYNALPQNDVGAQILNIPFNYDTKESIGLLKPANKNDVSLNRQTKIQVGATDLKVKTILTVTGELASGMRSRYANKDEEEIRQALQQSAASHFKNQVSLESFDVANLDNLDDTVSIGTAYSVKNEVIGVGDINMIKPPYMDVIATSDVFSNEPRQYPFTYWLYENTDHYTSQIEMELPAGKVFDQVPADVKASFRDMKYELTYQRVAPGKLIINRRFLTNIIDDIPASEVGQMKDFFNLIVNAEQKYISFK
jgi:tetratricopeptide (TPR) repeat protein